MLCSSSVRCHRDEAHFPDERTEAREAQSSPSLSKPTKITGGVAKIAPRQPTPDSQSTELIIFKGDNSVVR